MEQTVMPWLKVTAHAVLSADRVYRYVLYRSLDGEAWDDPDPERRTVCFVMLNPSTADENTNDPTIEKLIKYGRLWGFHRLAVVNLFAYRETDSKKLRSIASTRDLVGPENDAYISSTVIYSSKVVCAWGNQGDIQDRGNAVRKRLDLLALPPGRVWCFKQSLVGQPVHPLYQLDLAELVPYR